MAALVADLIDTDPRQPSSGSRKATPSATTRATIAPTVRHAIRSSSSNIDFDVRVAIHATVSSNTRVCRAPCRAHGTDATTTPCAGPVTRGASASKYARYNPRSGAQPMPEPARPGDSRWRGVEPDRLHTVSGNPWPQTAAAPG